MRILVGDIGGTNARFGVVRIREEHWQMVDERTLPSRSFRSFGDALSSFIDSVPAARRCHQACFGIAGPVRCNRCQTTNLPWVVEGTELADQLGLSRVMLLNDVEAAAWGLSVLDADGLRTLRGASREAVGNRALLAAGTGLGEAGLFWDGERHHPFATEGGHADFGPNNELQVELWRYMTQRHGHVSYERLVSGPGLVSLYRFLVERAGEAEPAWLERKLLKGGLLEGELPDGGAPAAISERATEESCPLCVAAVDLFFSLLGAEAGNVALRILATGGVFLAGGIVPRLLTETRWQTFLDAFTAKGRFQPLLESIPVHLVVDDRLALWGATARALEAQGQQHQSTVHLEAT